MKRLVLVTDVFPWGKGEKSFILPELQYLRKKFRVTILSRASMSMREDTENETLLGNDIEVLHYVEPELGRKDKLLFLFKAIANEEFRQEIMTVFREKRGIFCIKQTYFFWIRAVLLERWMKKARLFDDLENTIFYSYWANHAALALAMEKKDNCNIKFVSRIHGYDLYDERFAGGRQPFKKCVDKYINKMIFIARVGYEYYLPRYANDTERDKYAICKLGVPGPKGYPAGKESDVFRLVSCSKASKLKRVDLIIKALEKVDYKLEWHHFGAGPELEKLREMADAVAKRKDNICCILHGDVPNNEVHRFYQNEWVDCFITTSSSEGCPVSIMEALSYGIPIIGTDVGEIKYMIEGNGVLLQEEPSQDEVTSAINEVYNKSTSDSKSMRRKSLLLWERDYQLESNVDRFINILEEL